MKTKKWGRKSDVVVLCRLLLFPTLFCQNNDNKIKIFIFKTFVYSRKKQIIITETGNTPETRSVPETDE